MAIHGPADETGTRSSILDSAERFVQHRGFNGFSYADVAAELGVTKAALHYHFPGKAELGEALIDRYATRFADALAEIDATDAVALERLRAYTSLYLGVLRTERMCLCGMLAAEYQTLPDPMRQTVVDFFDDNIAWLTRLLRSGRVDRSITFSGKPEDAAQSIVGMLEGAMLVARPYRDVAKFEAVVSRLLTEFGNRATAGSR
jgi:TetR/AcrR family transcriptional repressor of nem operon